MDIGRVGRALAGNLERLAGDVERGHERAEPRQLRRRLAGCALEMKDVLAAHVGQQLADSVRDAELPGHRFGPAAMDLVPCFAVVLSGLHEPAPKRLCNSLLQSLAASYAGSE